MSNSCPTSLYVDVVGPIYKHTIHAKLDRRSKSKEQPCDKYD